VSIDEMGNTVTHETQMEEKEGRATFVNKNTTEDPEGKVIKV
jgi:hypothetical protein